MPYAGNRLKNTYECLLPKILWYFEFDKEIVHLYLEKKAKRLSQVLSFIREASLFEIILVYLEMFLFI